MPKLSDIKKISDMKPVGKLTRVKKTESSTISSGPEIRIRDTEHTDYVFREPSQKKSKHYLIWWVLGIALIAGYFYISNYFAHATITLTPKSIPFSFSNEQFTAKKDSVEGFSFQTLSLDDTETITLPNTAQTTKQATPATGTIVLYNTTAKNITLPKGKKVHTAANLIYALSGPVTIPASSKKTGSITPGSTTASVVAIVTGETGNSAMTDITVEGYGAKMLYGRAPKGFSGGQTGESVTNLDDIREQTDLAGQKLRTKLIGKTQAELPPGFITYESSNSFQSSVSPLITTDDTGTRKLTIHGTLLAYIFNKNSLIHTILDRINTSVGSDTVTIPELATLSVTPIVDAGVTPIPPLTPVLFTVTGTGTLVAVLDTSTIADKLHALPLKNFTATVESFGGVLSGTYTMSPFWKFSFPTSATHITVNVIDPSKK